MQGRRPNASIPVFLGLAALVLPGPVTAPARAAAPFVCAARNVPDVVPLPGAPEGPPEAPVAEAFRPEGAPAPAPGSLAPDAALPPGVFPPGGAGAGAEPRDPPVPTIAVRVRVPAEVEAGKELTYRLTVANTSRAAAHHVTLRNALPPGARLVRATPEPTASGTLLVWNLGTLDGCTRREITLVIVPGEGGEVQNCARVQYEHGQCVRTRVTQPGAAPRPPRETIPPRPPGPDGPRPVPQPLPPGSAAPTPPPPPVVQIRKTGPASAQLYDIVTYKVEVRNVGPSRARNVTVTDALPDGVDFINSKPATRGDGPLVWSLGDLEPGAVRRIEYDVSLKKTGEVVNRAFAEATGGVKLEARHTLRVESAALGVLLAGPKRRQVNRPTTFRLTVRNLGTAPLVGVTAANELPPEITFVGASDGGKLVDREVRWALGTLPAGAVRVLQVTVRSAEAGLFRSVATVTADRGLSEQSRAETRFVNEPSLAVEIDLARDSLPVGQVSTLVVRVVNHGGADETKVQPTITVPDVLELQDAKGPVAEVKGNVVTLAPIPKLAPGGEVVITLRVRAIKPGSGTVQVRVTSDALTGKDPLEVQEKLQVEDGKP